MRIRVKLDFVIDFGGADLPELGDLNDAFEGAVRGLYPDFDGEANIEPGGTAKMVRIFKSDDKKAKTVSRP